MSNNDDFFVSLSASTPTIPKLLTIKQVRQITELGESTVQKALVSGKLKSIRIGRRRLVSVVDLNHWIELNRS